jgi:hypothetical protein
MRQHLFRRQKAHTFRNIALLGGTLVSAGVVGYRLYQRRVTQQQMQSVDSSRDKSLKDTFPASDPPASQFYGIPANRL